MTLLERSSAARLLHLQREMTNDCRRVTFTLLPSYRLVRATSLGVTRRALVIETTRRESSKAPEACWRIQSSRRPEESLRLAWSRAAAKSELGVR